MLLRSSAYQTIRQRLLNGKLEPGKRVSELALSKEMGISRAPVREAINQLASEGLIMQIPNAGSFVKRPSRIDLENLYQLRMWLESEAAAETARRVTERRLRQMEEALREMQAVAHQHRETGEAILTGTLLGRHVTADLSFHLALIRGCGNRMVSKLVGDYHLMSQVWCALPEEHDLQNLARTYREHARIYRAVRNGRSDLARQYMQEHLALASRKALDRYDWRERQQATKISGESTWPEGLRETVLRIESWDDPDLD
jgi:DNA-binding GntR family transcriptional regulator